MGPKPTKCLYERKSEGRFAAEGGSRGGWDWNDVDTGWGILTAPDVGKRKETNST